MSGLTLDAEQRERARDILERVENDEATEPKDLVNEWKPCPRMAISGEATEKWVSLSDVVGTDPDLTDSFMKGRIEYVLRLLLENEFQPKYTFDPPHYIEIDGEFYVGNDGNHRTIVCKAVGVERIYARVFVLSGENPPWEVGHSSTNTETAKHNDEPSERDSSPEEEIQQRSVTYRIRQWATRLFN